jgi:predicted component of type VI protein secretion system
LDQEVVHIGAVAQDGGSKNDIVLQDVERMISRFHCEIHVKDGKLFLIDCNSSNGTKLDGRRVAPGTPVRLKGGSRVDLGGTCALRVGYEKRRKT